MTGVGPRRARHLGPTAAAFVDGALDLATRDAVVAHLAECPRCRDEVAQQRRMKALLGDLPRPPLPEGLADRLAGLTRGGSGAPVAGPRAAAASEGVRRPEPRPARTPVHPPADGPGRVARPRRAAGRRVRTLVGAGGAVVLIGASAAGFGGGQAAAEPVVTPPVQQFTAEHLAVAGSLPLTAPGLRVGQVLLTGGAAPGLATAPGAVAWQLPGAEPDTFGSVAR